MSGFKKNFRDNIVAPYNKYNLSQEKLGEVLDTNKKKKCCTVSYKNVDGIKVIKENVPFVGKSNLFGGFPKIGDKVTIQEVGKTIRILGIADSGLIEAEKETGDIFSNASSFGGHLGV